MGNQIRLAGGNINRREIGKRNRETSRRGRTLFGLAAKECAGEQRKQVAAGLLCLRRQARTTVIDGINVTLQKEADARHNRYARRTFPILPLASPGKAESGCRPVALLASRHALASPAGRLMAAVWGRGPAEAAPTDRGTGRTREMPMKTPDDELLANLAPRLNPPRDCQTRIGCIGAGFIMADCHLVAYRAGGLQSGGHRLAARRATPSEVAARHGIASVLRHLSGAAGRSRRSKSSISPCRPTCRST